VTALLTRSMTSILRHLSYDLLLDLINRISIINYSLESYNLIFAYYYFI